MSDAKIVEVDKTLVIILLYNNVHLSKACLQSVRQQDVPVTPWLLNNSSKDGTAAWVDSQTDVLRTNFSEQKSVAAAWNYALRWAFIEKQLPAVVMLNNDTQLRPDSVRHLLTDGGLFVTCVGKRDPACVEPPFEPPDPASKRPHPDFSCYLIRQECFDRVGEFDENFKRAFVEDGDYHARMHQAGIQAECLDLPFYHYGSATVKHCDAKERLAIQRQADLNRRYFAKKYGFEMASPEYYAFFGTGEPASEPPAESAHL